MGATLRERRLELDLTQDDVANLIGVTNVTISVMERGHSLMKPRLYRALAKALQMPPEQMGKLWLSYQAPDIYAMIYGPQD